MVADSPTLNQGTHDVRVEYNKASGNGSIRVRWQKKYQETPPQAAINGSTRVQVGQTASFNARNSRAAAGSHLVTFEWDFGDGTAATGVDVTHAYNAANTYEVKLTVIDDKGLSNTASHAIQVTEAPVTPEPPQAVIDAPDNGVVGQAATFNAGNSTATHPIVSYQWDFGDGTSANAVVINKTYNTAGVFNVRLTVIDDQGLQGQTTKQIAIADPAATPTPPATETPVPGNTPTPTETPAPENTPTPEPTETPVPGDTPTPTETPAPEDTPTPEPTETPVPEATDTPTPAPQAPVINSFTAEPAEINLNDSVTLAWDFSGQDLALVRLFRGAEVIASDFANTGTLTDTPPSTGQIIYELVVDSEFGGSARQSVAVNVVEEVPPEETPTPSE